MSKKRNRKYNPNRYSARSPISNVMVKLTPEELDSLRVIPRDAARAAFEEGLSAHTKRAIVVRAIYTLTNLKYVDITPRVRKDVEGFLKLLQFIQTANTDETISLVQFKELNLLLNYAEAMDEITSRWEKLQAYKAYERFNSHPKGWLYALELEVNKAL